MLEGEDGVVMKSEVSRGNLRWLMRPSPLGGIASTLPDGEQGVVIARAVSRADCLLLSPLGRRVTPDALLEGEEPIVIARLWLLLLLGRITGT